MTAYASPPPPPKLDTVFVCVTDKFELLQLTSDSLTDVSSLSTEQFKQNLALVIWI